MVTVLSRNRVKAVTASHRYPSNVAPATKDAFAQNITNQGHREWPEDCPRQHVLCTRREATFV